MIQIDFRTMLSLLWFLFLPLLAFNQLLKEASSYSRYDTLLGTITDKRDYNVTFYRLKVDVDIEQKSISGNSQMDFIASHPMDTLQLDLFSRYQIHDLQINEKPCQYYRDSNHIFIFTHEIITESKPYHLSIRYSGQPLEAKNAPWDGGFIWKKDSLKRNWIGVACEGLGASSWWACKDHWSDEPDHGVEMTIRIPSEYKAISNGKLIYQKQVPNNQSEWVWRVSEPINLYNITLNIGHYEPIRSVYKSKVNGRSLQMIFWVLDYNLQKAKKHFQQVTPMLDCYESQIGPYPFYADGYQLVETPYLGMEHQSCIAYGNKYFSGYLGNKKMTGGHDFDYIIIHETGHEWFGNNITAADNADMWIHEALTTYAESIYAECMYGTGDQYINKMKSRVGNRHPIQGDYGVAKEGNGDMYAKGALFFHTLRYQIADDSLWAFLLKDINQTFAKKTTNYAEILKYFNQKTNQKWDDLFAVYLQYAKIPEIVVTKKESNQISQIQIQLSHEHPKLEFMIYYKINGKDYKATLEKEKQFELKIPTTDKFELDETKGYFKIKIL